MKNQKKRKFYNKPELIKIEGIAQSTLGSYLGTSDQASSQSGGKKQPK